MTNKMTKWTDNLPESVYARLCNCQTLKADLPALVNAKWLDYVKSGKDRAGFTKEDALISVLELLDCNSSGIEITKDEYSDLCS